MVLASAEKIDADGMVQVEALRTPGTTMLQVKDLTIQVNCGRMIVRFFEG
jgi:hypothetical protein